MADVQRPMFTGPRLSSAEVLQEALDASTTDDRCDEEWVRTLAERVIAAAASVPVLTARLSELEAAASDALTILEGCHSGDLDDWDRIAVRLRAALNDEGA